MLVTHGQVWKDKLYICRPIPGKKLFAPVGILTRITDEDNNEHWTIEPIWENYKPVEEGGYGFDTDDDEIFSCNMDLHKDVYEFNNLVPGIVEKRIPPRRYDKTYFDMIGVQYFDIVDILIATKGLCNDKFAFLPYEEKYSTPFEIPEVEKFGMGRLMYET